MAKASLMSGGVPRGWEKSVMCQNPMQNIDQNATIGFGRSTRKIKAVTTTFRARASSRRSSQWWRVVLGKNWNETGNEEGKPIDDRPWELNGRKSTKLPVSRREAHPPLESLMSPLGAYQVSEVDIKGNSRLTLGRLQRK